MTAKPIPCTVEILTRNSERGISRCLETLAAFAEVIVQDGYSTDRTAEIAQKFPNVTFLNQDRTFLDSEGRISDFSAIRNQGLKAAAYEWILVVDSDEVVQPAMIDDIRSIVEGNHPGVYTVFRRFFVDGKRIEYSSVYPAIQIRLFHRSLVDGYVKTVHERLALKPGVIPVMLSSELPVPLPPARDLAAKYHRYLLMEAVRAQDISFLGWCRWILYRNIRTIAGFVARLLWIWLIPRRGKRLPLAYECQFIAYACKTIVYTFPLFRR